MNLRTLACVVMAAVAASAGSTALAQSAGVTSTATIVTPITAAVTSQLAFGTITKGSLTTVPATSASAAAVTFSGDEGDNIVVTVPATLQIATLAGSGSGITVAIDRSSLRSNSTNSQGNATLLNASAGSATVTLSTDTDGDALKNDGLGQTYLWIGGSVTPAATQQRGTYSGTFTISAAYSN